MKRETYTTQDVTGKEGEAYLKEYNEKLMHPDRPFGTAASEFVLPEAKQKRTKRMHSEETAIKKQMKIAKQHKMEAAWSKDVREPHRFAKHHAMDCGNPKCMMCGNPRKTWHELTAQEKRMHQEMDVARMRHSNGVLPLEDD